MGENADSVTAVVTETNDGLASLDSRDITPGWIRELTAIADALPLDDATELGGLGTDLRTGLLAIGPSDDGDDQGRVESRRAASALVMVGDQLQRLIGWAQVTQLQVTAALARPGVAVPIGEVLSAISAGRQEPLDPPSGSGVDPDLDIDLRQQDLDARQYRGTSVCGRPEWDCAVAEQAARFAAAEFGAALRLSPITAHARVAEAVGFVDDLPLTTRCWRNGRLDRSRAVAIARATVPLDAVARCEVEQDLLADGGVRAGAMTTSRLRARVERLVIRHDPDAAIERRSRAHGERQLQVNPRDDGMARFSADLDAPVALLAHEVFDTVARGLDGACRAGRTLGQLRADVFADVVVALAVDGRVDVREGRLGTRPGDVVDAYTPPESADTADGPDMHCAGRDPALMLPPRWREIGSSVSVIVDAEALGTSSPIEGGGVEPGFLAGFGWIPPDLALALATSARRADIIVRHRSAPERRDPPLGGFVPPPDRTARPPDRPAPRSEESELLGHGETSWCGGVLDYGRTVYRPPVALDEHVRRRDRRCRFPACRMPGHRCDLDHRQPFADGGATCPCNLDALCRFHHRIKTFTGWSAVRVAGDRLRWTSPLGAVLLDEPDPVPAMTTAASSDDPPPF